MQNPDEIFVIDASGLKPLPYRSMRAGLFGKSLEDALQTLLQHYPQVIPGKQIDPGSDNPPRFVLLRREMPIGGWSLDHLYVDQQGTLTLVETKLIQNPESRREVIGQIIEYAANAREIWTTSRARELANDFWSKQGKEIDALLMEEFGIEDIEAFWETVEDNLKHGQVRLILASDELHPAVRRMIEYLNDEMQNAEVLGLELRCYGDDPNQIVLVPRLVGLTEATRQQKGHRMASSGHTSKQEFLDSCPEGIRPFFVSALEKAERKDIIIYWGKKGFSFRVLTESGEPNSVFYGYPPGAHGRAYSFVWGIARNLGDAKYDEEVRSRFSKIAGATKYGQYGYELALTEDNLNAAQQFIDIFWNLVDELKHKHTPPN